MSELKNYASAAQPQAVQKLDAYTNFRTQGKNYLETLQNLSKEDRNPDFLKTLSVALDRFLATGVQIPMTNIYVLRGGTQVMSPQQRALYEAAILFSQTFEPYFLGESKDSSELKAIKNLFRGALSDPMKQEDSVKRFLDLAARKMEDYTSGFPGAVYGNRKKLEFSPTKESVLPPGPSTPVPRDFNPTKESVLPPGPSTRVPVENSILDFILRSYTFSRGRSNSSK